MNHNFQLIHFPHQSSIIHNPPFLCSLTSPIRSMELLQSTVVSRVTGAWELKSDLDRLRNSTLPRVNDLMEKAEWWRFKDKHTARLLKELRDAAYDAEDVLAEFDYYELKQRIEGQNTSQLWSSLSSFIKNLVNNYASKVKDVQTKLDSISRELESVIRPFGLPDGPNPYGKAVQQETSSFQPEVVLGRDDEVERVVKLIMQPGDEFCSSSSSRAKRMKTGNFSVLPLVGIGGVGKTTLAQLIYNDERVKNHFDLRIWVCVSDYFDLKKITTEMIESANKVLGTKEELRNSAICIGETLTNLNSLQQTLKEKVASRRYLIVLDDVWHNTTRDWESLCSPLRSGLKGSMILITTRMSTVAKIVGTLDYIEVKDLPPDIYWDLFKKCTFGSSDPSSFPELEDIGRKIAAKLKGSPLAAKTLGGILHANMNIDQWRNILNSELWQIEQSEGDILPALRVSYQYLPVHLKRCFQTFSLFPKDFSVCPNFLQLIWVSDGIINREDEKAQVYFQDLKNRSFFITDKYGILTLHDLMHDLSISLSRGSFYCLEDNNESLENHNSVRHLSVYRKSIEWIDKEIGRCKNLRSLQLCDVIGSKINMSSSTLASLFNQLTYLRFLYLELCQIEELPHNVGNLKLLLYINLRYNKIKTLPDSICQLYNLQVIDVQGCPLESFPKYFHKLINLRVITTHMEISTKIPSIGTLTSLENLREFKVLKEDGHRIEELKNMTRLRGWLRGSLTISNIENIEGQEDAARACLNNKEHLNELVLCWSPSRSTNSGSGGTVIDENIIEGLKPHPNLQYLSIQNYGGRTPASWLQSKMLPHLKYLCIEGCLNLESLNDWFLPHQFSSLQSLEIIECANLVSLSLEWINSSSLIRLTIRNCPLLSCPSNLILPSSLTSLCLISCGELDMSLPGCLQNLDSLQNLELVNCQHVTSLPSHVSRHIKFLTLRNCAELQCVELSNPSILENLSIEKCPKLIQSGPSISDSEAPLERIQTLGQLSIDNTSLLKLPFLRNPPPSLDSLIISNSPEERLFTGELHGWLNVPERLQRLEILNCYNLESLPEEFHTLVTVTWMILINCPKIQSLPKNGLPPSLTQLHFHDCHPALTEELKQQQKAITERNNKELLQR